MREFEDDDNQQEGDDEEANGEVDGSESEYKEEEMGERQELEKKIIALDKHLQVRQSREIKTPQEVLEARELRDLEPTLEGDEAALVDEFDLGRPPIRTLDKEVLYRVGALDFTVESFTQSKNKRKKKRRGPDNENSKLSIPGDEATEISRISVSSDEATVFSVEDSEDWDSFLRASTRKSLLAGSKTSTSSRRSTRLRRPRSSTYIVPEIISSEHPGNNREDDRGASSVVSELINRARMPRSRSRRTSAGSEGSYSEGEYLIDEHGNFILDGDGHKIPFSVPPTSYTNSDLDPEDSDGPPTTNPSGQNMPSLASAPQG
jgi:hypothetical protein